MANRTEPYTDALAAVQKEPDQVTIEDRKAVETFLEEIGYSEGRVRFFYSQLLADVVLRKNKTAELVNDNARRIVDSLHHFVAGKLLPPDLVELKVVEHYIQYWIDLAGAEEKMFGMLSRLSSSPAAKRLRESMAKD